MPNDEVSFDLYDQQDVGGEDALKAVASKLYGGTADGKGRQSWSTLLFQRKGSVLWRVIPQSLVGGVIAFCLVVVKQAYKCPDFLADDPDYHQMCWFLPELKHPFVVQIFSIILSFVIVRRNDIAVDRYFDGMENVHVMSSRWMDCFTSLMGFLRASADLHPADSRKQESCVAIGLAMLHWATLAHALAVNSLQCTQLGIDEKIWEFRVHQVEPPDNMSLTSDSYEKSEGIGTGSKSKGGGASESRSRARSVKQAVSAERRVSISADTGIAQIKENKTSMRELGKLGVYGPVTKEETTRLHSATDKVAIVLMWMEEAVTRGQIQGVILTAPPILARVYNELGSGLQGFNAAYRIALVPFPLCFAQMIGWCLVVFVILCPACTFVFTGGEILTSTLTWFSLMGFWGLNRIAIELENPFGCEVSHLPLAELHHAYVEGIGEMHIHPMPEYKWAQKEDGSSNLPGLLRNLASAGK